MQIEFKNMMNLLSSKISFFDAECTASKELVVKILFDGYKKFTAETVNEFQEKYMNWEESTGLNLKPDDLKEAFFFLIR